MKRLFASHRVSLAVAVTALGLVVAGGALAAGSGGSISACVKKHGGMFYSAKKCSRGDKKLTWSARGPAGPQGPAGAAGAAGAAGTAGAAGPSALSIRFADSTDSTTVNTIATFGPITLGEECYFDGSNIWEEIWAKNSSSATWTASGMAANNGTSVTPYNAAINPTTLGASMTDLYNMTYLAGRTAANDDIYISSGGTLYHVSLYVSQNGLSCQGVGDVVTANSSNTV